MKTFTDHQGKVLRLTDDRVEHIQEEHPEALEFILAHLAETLGDPSIATVSYRDPEIRLYHRFYETADFGNKYLLVVAKVLEDDAFIITAFLTDRIKR